MLLPQTCPGCQSAVLRRCDRCRAALAAAPRCTAPEGVLVSLAFDGLVRRLILGLKYRGRWGVVPLLVDVLEREVRSSGLERSDVVTWAPTSPARRRRRGADQAQVLARGLARRLGVPCRRLLRRVGGVEQTGRGRTERLSGPHFVARPLAPGTTVLVVDDVVTTGATLLAAARALERAGARRVTVAAVAATLRSPVAQRWEPAVRR